MPILVSLLHHLILLLIGVGVVWLFTDSLPKLFFISVGCCLHIIVLLSVLRNWKPWITWLAFLGVCTFWIDEGYPIGRYIATLLGV